MKQTLRVLLVEDEPNAAWASVTALKQGGYEVTSERVETIAALTDAFAKAPWDIVLCDYNLPTFQAPEALSLLREKAPDTPCIVVSGTVGEELAVDLMRQGASDFVAKEKLSRLVPAAKRALREANTRQKRRESEANYRAFVEHSADGILIADSETKVFKYANPAMCRMLGYTQEELGTLGLANIHPKVALPHVAAEFEAQTRGEKTLAADLPCIRKDGTIFHADINATNIIIDGRACLVGIYRDITERKKADELLRESELQYRTLFESSRDALMTLAPPAWRFTSANPATLSLFGVESEARLTALGLWNVAPEKQADGALSSIKAPQMIERAMKDGSHFFEWTHQRLDGQVFPATVLLTRMELKGQSLLQATIRDVTEQKRLEIELTHARKLESVGQLAAGIAHEINTPTQFVGDNLQFLRDAFGNLMKLIDEFREVHTAFAEKRCDPVLSAKLEEALAKADLDYLTREIPKAIDQSLGGVQRISSIVRALKDFSHPGGTEKEMANLNHGIETTATVARNEWKYVAELEMNLDPDLPPVPCFVSEMNQVFLNLIVNASHAIEAAGVKDQGVKGRILITTRQDGDSVDIRISDTGTGIAPEHRGRMFEPFFTTKAAGKGTGQGLALAYQIVKKHGGTIRFETEVGKGTTFAVRLPLSLPAEIQRT